MLSQFPAEKEILFAPLTGVEVASVPRVEGDVHFGDFMRVHVS